MNTKVKKEYGHIRKFNFWLLVIFPIGYLIAIITPSSLGETTIPIYFSLGLAGLSILSGIILIVIGLPLYLYKLIITKKNGGLFFKVDYLLMAILLILVIYIFSLFMDKISEVELYGIIVGINLLLWQEVVCKKIQQQFVLSVIGVVVLGVIGIGVGNSYMNSKIYYQNKKNTYIQDKIKRLEIALKESKTLVANKNALVERAVVMQRLFSTRVDIVHLFDKMIYSLPEGLYLSKLVQKGNMIKLEGKAESSARVTSYMNGLIASPWISSSEPNTIKFDLKYDDNHLHYFSFSVKLSDMESKNGD